MKFTLTENLALLEFVLVELQGEVLVEAKQSKLTPYQKAVMKRRAAV